MTTSWHTGRLACFDLETSGIDAHRDRIVTAAIVEVGGGQPTRESNWLVNPGIPIPPGASDVHGITDDVAAGGMDAGQAVYEIAEHLTRLARAGVPIVGHNVGGYDLTMLWAECMRHGHRDHVASLEDLATEGCVIDTFVLDKAVDTYRKGSRKLVDVAAHYGITLTEAEAHGATADALASGRIAWVIATRYPHHVQRSAKDLHVWQVMEKHAQAESFGRYLRKQGKPDDVAREWPLQNPPADWSPDQIPAPREDAA